VLAPSHTFCAARACGSCRHSPSVRETCFRPLRGIRERAAGYLKRQAAEIGREDSTQPGRTRTRARIPVQKLMPFLEERKKISSSLSNIYAVLLAELALPIVIWPTWIHGAVSSEQVAKEIGAVVSHPVGELPASKKGLPKTDGE